MSHLSFLAFLALSGAAAVWEAAIQADMKMWKSLAQESSKSVAGIPHEILNRCKKTVFVGACADLATASDGRLHSVGFLTNPVVRACLAVIGHEREYGKSTHVIGPCRL
jgi:hypothetical protein